VMMFALLWSMVVVLVRRGIVWRGTRYPLHELRRHNSPFVWERDARKKRDDGIRAVRVAKRLAEKKRKNS
jgi:hypothetical protein